MKRYLRIFLVVMLLLVTAVACQGGEEQAEETEEEADTEVMEETEETEEEMAEEPADEPEEPAGEPTEIRVITFAQGFAWPDLFGSDGLAETDRLLAFEEAENIDVIVEWGDETAVRQKVGADLAAGTGRYCVMVLGTDGNVQTYGTGGRLEPLGPYFDSVDQDYVNLEDYYPSLIEANTVEGSLFGLPYYSFGPGMIYRTDIFEEYGVEPPTTVEELYEVLETLKQGLAEDGIDDVYPLTMRAGPGEEPSLDLLGFVYANAGNSAWFEGGASTPEEIRSNSAQPTFTDPAFAEGFKDFTTLAAEYGPPGIATHTWVDMMNLYMQGNAVILMPSAINGYAALTSTENETVRDNSAYAPAPTGASGDFIQSFWAFSLGINKDCPEKEAAFKTLALLTGNESHQGFADNTGWPAVAIHDIMFSEPIVERWGEDEVQLNEDAIVESNPYYFPYIPELNEFMDRIGTAASTVVAGEKDADQALQELNDWATERMERAGYYE